MQTQTENTRPMPSIMRLKEAANHLQVSLTTLWRLAEEDEDFPKKIRMSKRCVGYFRKDLDNWLEKKGV